MSGSESAAPLRVAVAGAAGRMGRELSMLALETEGVELAGAFERPGHDWIGSDLGPALGLGRTLGVRVEDDPIPACARAEAVLDFTAPALSVALAELAAERGFVHVVGTTGLAAADLERIDAVATRAVVVRSGNMSLGVNLVAGLVRKVAEALGDDWDAEIFEMHHGRKVDAPSGTALLLGEAVAAGRGVALEAVADRGRDGHTGARGKGRIGFAALRGGDVVGEHEAIFAGAGERVILRHVATDRTIYARGALRAAFWARGRPPGAYSMADVLGLAPAAD